MINMYICELIFESGFKFTAKFIGRCSDVSYIHPFLSPAGTASPTVNITHRSGTFITGGGSTLSHHNHAVLVLYSAWIQTNV